MLLRIGNLIPNSKANFLNKKVDFESFWFSLKLLGIQAAQISKDFNIYT